MKNFVLPSNSNRKDDIVSEYLDLSIEAFSKISGIPVTFYRTDNSIAMEYEEQNKLCKMFPIYQDEADQCRKNLSFAGQFSSRLGEPYIFLCKAGLANIAVPLIVRKNYLGYYIAGPIIMGELRNSTDKKFRALNNLSEEQMDIARMITGKMDVYSPSEITRLALLFYNSILSGIEGNQDYSTLRNQYDEQNKINEQIQKYKKEHFPIEYPYDLEKNLVESITNGNVAATEEALKKLLQSFSIIEVGNLDGVKAKTIWLFAIIMRMGSDNSNKLNEYVDTDLDVINKISDADSYSDLESISISILRNISKNWITSIYSGQSQIISAALQFIHNNYRKRISLSDIDKNLHVNASYFSTLFKQEMGITFTDYISKLRIEYACDLLKNSHLNVVDVSVASGFEDQSYFTKVFKKAKGISPKAYRNENAKKNGAE